jgi:uncharacterized membrane protein
MTTRTTLRIALLGTALCMIFIPVLSGVAPAHATAPQGTFVTFDIPGSDLGIQQPDGINPSGAIAGVYSAVINQNSVLLGFLRAPDGTVTTIAPPGSTFTFVGSPFFNNGGPPINPAGALAGYYFDASGAEHGFLRAPNGTFSTFDPLGSTSTFPSGINPEGAISGGYFDANSVLHGFLRARDGTITTFDVPGAFNGTRPGGINPAGVIVGAYSDANFVNHGFLRASDGTFTTFDPPGSAAPFGTFSVIAINPAGAIVGSYGDGFAFHGFLRARDGTFTTMDPPGATSSAATAINPGGVVAGSYGDATGAFHGFLFLPF